MLCPPAESTVTVAEQQHKRFKIIGTDAHLMHRFLFIGTDAYLTHRFLLCAKFIYYFFIMHFF